MPQFKAWLASSQDPSKVSNTVKGAVLAASSIIIFAGAQVFHIQLTASDVAALATELGALAGAMLFLYGLLFKGVVYAGTKR